MILRKITRMVQIAPFVYLLFLSIYLLAGIVLPEWSLRIFDNLLNAPVYAAVAMLGAGRMLKLCRWFKAACLLPATTKLESYVDSFVITFTQNEVIIINTCLGIMFLAFIFCAIRHFSHA